MQGRKEKNDQKQQSFQNSELVQQQYEEFEPELKRTNMHW
jgi:hypothetical protein